MIEETKPVKFTLTSEYEFRQCDFLKDKEKLEKFIQSLSEEDLIFWNSRLFLAKEPRTWILLKNEEIIGLVHGHKSGGRSCSETGIAVKLEYRNKGIGTFLMKFIIEEAKKEGFKKLRVFINANNLSSIKLHEKLGYNKRGASTYEKDI